MGPPGPDVSRVSANEIWGLPTVAMNLDGALVKRGAPKPCSQIGASGTGGLKPCTQTAGMCDYHGTWDDYSGHEIAVGDIQPWGTHDSYVLVTAPYLTFLGGINPGTL